MASPDDFVALRRPTDREAAPPNRPPSPRRSRGSSCFERRGHDDARAREAAAQE